MRCALLVTALSLASSRFISKNDLCLEMCKQDFSSTTARFSTYLLYVNVVQCLYSTMKCYGVQDSHTASQREYYDQPILQAHFSFITRKRGCLRGRHLHLAIYSGKERMFLILYVLWKHQHSYIKANCGWQ